MVGDPINILFEVNQRRKASAKKDEYLTFKAVLRPIKIIDQAEVVNLLAGNIENHLQTPSGFPSECVLLAYDESLGGSFGIGYKTSKACNDAASRANIVGQINVQGVSLCAKLAFRIDGRTE